MKLTITDATTRIETDAFTVEAPTSQTKIQFHRSPSDIKKAPEKAPEIKAESKAWEHPSKKYRSTLARKPRGGPFPKGVEHDVGMKIVDALKEGSATYGEIAEIYQAPYYVVSRIARKYGLAYYANNRFKRIRTGERIPANGKAQ